tara:strand:+ start:554 stop:742 length:189 start_codon:yes stop_codon:yes gene_type:complete
MYGIRPSDRAQRVSIESESYDAFSAKLNPKAFNASVFEIARQGEYAQKSPSTEADGLYSESG